MGNLEVEKIDLRIRRREIFERCRGMNEFTELFKKSKALIDNARSSMGVVVNALTVDHQNFPFKLSWTHYQDLRQMQMYVNYYDRYEIIEGENPTIGILMCKQSDEALVELTLCSF